MATVNCPGLTTDRCTRGQSATWATARSTGTAAFGETDNYGYAQVDAEPGAFYVDRTWWRFDTSVIGAGATVTAVTLNFDVITSANNGLSDSIGLTTGTVAAGTGSIVASDHGSVGSTDLITRYTWGSYDAGAYSRALNASGIAAINVTGETVLVFRNGTDISNSAPVATRWTYASFASANHALSSMRPSLDVTYTAAVVVHKPTIKRQAVNRSATY